jgi:hypothetical protein
MQMALGLKRVGTMVYIPSITGKKSSRKTGDVNSISISSFFLH